MTLNSLAHLRENMGNYVIHFDRVSIKFEL